MTAIWCDSRNFHRFTSAKVYDIFPVNCMDTILSRGEGNACHFTFSPSLDHFTEGGSLRDFLTRKDTKIFVFFSA